MGRQRWSGVTDAVNTMNASSWAAFFQWRCQSAARGPLTGSGPELACREPTLELCFSGSTAYGSTGNGVTLSSMPAPLTGLLLLELCCFSS